MTLEGEDAMQPKEQIRTMKLLMQRLDDGVNVDTGCTAKNPITAYTCPERARAEWDKMFQSFPQVLGLSGDLPEPVSVEDAQTKYAQFESMQKKQG